MFEEITIVSNRNYHQLLFFSLERKEPKVQDCQKKSENSTVRFTEILKLARQYKMGIYSYTYIGGLKQSEFQPFRSPEFLLIFSEGRKKKSESINDPFLY